MSACWCGCGRPAYRAGLWGACYVRWRKAGRPAQVPPPRGRGNDGHRADRVEDYAEICGQGYRLEHAAARLGVSERTAWRYEAALRQQGETAA